MFRQRVRLLPHENVANSTHLIGYYDLGDLMKVPVLAHQDEGFKDVISKAAKPGHSFAGTPAASCFDDVPPPYPTKHMLRALVDYVRQIGVPPFVSIQVQGSAERTAQLLTRDGGLDAGDWMLAQFEASLSRLAYRSPQHFREDVYRLLAGMKALHPTHNPESMPALTSENSPAVRQVTSRELPKLVDVARKAIGYLDGEQVLDSLYLDELPACRWTAKSNRAFLATWTLRTAGKSAGSVMIRVNVALRVARKLVSDEMLEYLLFHELLHHLLPGHGHTAEFRRLESLWPGADQLDLAFDTLHERVPMGTRHS
jgi:hypothetical protein